MCFNALFCIDFFMTKRIIRDLKKQIPNNLLEDRWNKLVQEKYAKLALERIVYLYFILYNLYFYLIVHRKKDDPPPKRKSSAAVRKIPTNGNVQSPNSGEGLQISNPIPKISAYLRRKSESYLSRRRSDECEINTSFQKLHQIHHKIIHKEIKEEDSRTSRKY